MQLCNALAIGVKLYFSVKAQPLIHDSAEADDDQGGKELLSQFTGKFWGSLRVM